MASSSSARVCSYSGTLTYMGHSLYGELGEGEGDGPVAIV